jgi:tripartite-type tricarboxylate transporter receptor subunit TctC
MKRRIITRQCVLMAISAVVAAILAAIAAVAPAQQPGRAITIIVPYTPGSGPDILARLLGEEIQTRWSQPVVVDNKPGASGNIGTQLAARAAPDGHTILMTTSPFVINASLFKALPYDPVTSFDPVILVATGALALTVHPSLPVKTTKEFIAYAKAHPGELNYGSPGAGTPHHLAMELFKLQTKTDLKHIPYRGSAGATQDLAGGHVSAGFQAVHVALPLVQAGQLRLLGVASMERVPAAADVPTLDSEGVKDFDVPIWYGIFTPAGTPPAIIARYNTTLNDILRSPQVIETLAKQGLVTVGGTTAALSALIKSERVKWEKVVTEAGIAKVE